MDKIHFILRWGIAKISAIVDPIRMHWAEMDTIDDMLLLDMPPRVAEDGDRLSVEVGVCCASLESTSGWF